MMSEAIDLYYEMMGWEKTTGAPTRAKLYELGLDDLVERMAGGSLARALGGCVASRTVDRMGGFWLPGSASVAAHECRIPFRCDWRSSRATCGTSRRISPAFSWFMRRVPARCSGPGDRFR